MVRGERKQKCLRGYWNYTVGLPALHNSDVYIWEEGTYVGCKERHDAEI
jgi:hypothetical protein